MSLYLTASVNKSLALGSTLTSVERRYLPLRDGVEVFDLPVEELTRDRYCLRVMTVSYESTASRVTGGNASNSRKTRWRFSCYSSRLSQFRFLKLPACHPIVSSYPREIRWSIS